MRKIIIFAITVLLAGSVSAQKKGEPNWQKVILATVDFKSNKNAVTLSAADNFKSLQIRTGDAPVHIDNIVVIFDNAEPEKIPIRFDFKPNTESRPIVLSNNKSKIKEIDIIYRAVVNTETNNATIEVWGTK